VIFSNDPAEQLDHFLDRLATEHDAALNSFTSDATATFHALDAADSSANPRPGFLTNLKEELGMTESTYPIRLPTRKPFLAGDASLPRLRPVVPSIRRRLPTMRWINWFATAALLLVTMGGAYLALLAPKDHGMGGVPTVPAAAPAASPSPEAAQSFQCDATNAY
jgi:hypothetical protein